MPSLTTDDVYAYFVKQGRPLTSRSVAAHFDTDREHINRLLRKLVEREKRLAIRKVSTCKFEYEIVGEVQIIPTNNYFEGWGNAPKLG